MEHFSELINLVDTSIKDNIKEGDYIKLMSLITNIYRTKEVEKIHTISEDDLTDYDDLFPPEDNNIYGDYDDIYTD